MDLPVPKTVSTTVDVLAPKVDSVRANLPVPRPPGAASSVDLPTPLGLGGGGMDLPIPVGGTAPASRGAVESGHGGFQYRDLGEQPPPIPSTENWARLPVPTELKAMGSDLDGAESAFVPTAPSPNDLGSPYSPSQIPEEDDGAEFDYDALKHATDLEGLELGAVDAFDAPISEPLIGVPARAASKPSAKPRGKGSAAILGSLVALVVVICVVGIGLGFTPYGFFGKDIITETLFPETQDDALQSPIVVSSEKRLALDTYRDHRDAIREVEAARRAGRKGEGVTAYLAFLYELYSIRYGEAMQYAAAADGLYESELRLDDVETPATLLAAAAKAVKQADANKARDYLGRLMAASDKNGDGLQLLGELELEAQSFDKAISAFEQLAQVEKRSPRSLFGLARARIAQDQSDLATQLLAEIIAAQPNHMGAVIEQAKLMAARDQQTEALALLDRVEGEKGEYASPLEHANGLVVKGDILRDREKLDDALVVYREASKLDDQSLEALLGMGEIHQLRGNVAEALANFKLAQGIDPANIQALLGASEALISSVGEGNLQKAREDLERALQQHPDNPRVHYLLGNALKQLNHPDQAEAAYRKSIELNKIYLDPYLALSNLLLSREHVEDAMEILATARQEMPNDPRIATTLGRGYMDRGELSEAESQFRQALRISPNHLPALFSLGVTLRRMSRLNDAQATFERLASIDPRYPGLVMEQGLVLERTGQPEQALAIYRHELERNPEDVEMKLRVAAALVLVSNCDEAMVMLRDVVRQRPDSAEALFYQGRCMLDRGQLAEAERALTRAVDLEGENGSYRSYLGWACLEIGQLDRAATELQRAVEIDPTNPVAVWQRGVLLLRSASPQAAVRDLERALELNPEMHEVYHYLALAYDQMRRPADAIRYFEMAIQFNPNDFESQFTLAQIITDQRGPRSGLLQYERAVEIGRRMDPTPRHYYDALFSYGATLHQVGRSDDALIILREYLQNAPSTSIDREEAVELVRLLSSGNEHESSGDIED